MKKTEDQGIKRYGPFRERHSGRFGKGAKPQADTDQSDDNILNEKTRFEKPYKHGVNFNCGISNKQSGKY